MLHLLFLLFGSVAFPAEGRLIEDEGHKEVDTKDPKQDRIECNYGLIHASSL
jgi:hypothetical protein